MKNLILQKREEGKWYDWGNFPVNTQEQIEKLVYAAYYLGTISFVEEVRVLNEDELKEINNGNF